MFLHVFVPFLTFVVGFFLASLLSATASAGRAEEGFTSPADRIDAPHGRYAG
jgi:hypothetical protein